MLDKADIWVVIVTYNSARYIGRCLSSVYHAAFNIAVVDNASTDATLMLVKDCYPKVISMNNLKNIGFAVGVNQGIRVALKRGAKYVVILNPDTTVKERALEMLVDFLSGEERRGVAGPAIEHVDFINGKRRWDLGGNINWLLGRATHINVAKLGNHLLSERRDYVSGCCMAIKVEVFRKIGLFDERFFMYYEDDDFCTRAIRAGFTVWNVPATVVSHKFVRSSGWLSPFSSYHLTRSAILFGMKWLSFPRRVLGITWLLSQAILFSRTRVSAGLASFKAIIDCLLLRTDFSHGKDKIAV